METTQLFRDTYEPPAPPDMGVLDRSFYHLLGAVPAATEGLTNSLSNLAYGEPQTTGPTPETSLPSPQTTAGKISEVALGHVLPYGLEVAAGGVMGRAAGLGNLARVSPTLARAAIDAVGFGAAAGSEGRDVAAEQSGEGAMLGAISGLPLPAKVPLAALLALASKSFFDSKDASPVAGPLSQGDIAGIANFVMPLLPGHPGFREGVLPDNGPLTRSVPEVHQMPNRFETPASEVITDPTQLALGDQAGPTGLLMDRPDLGKPIVTLPEYGGALSGRPDAPALPGIPLEMQRATDAPIVAPDGIGPQPVNPMAIVPHGNPVTRAAFDPNWEVLPPMAQPDVAANNLQRLQNTMDWIGSPRREEWRAQTQDQAQRLQAFFDDVSSRPDYQPAPVSPSVMTPEVTADVRSHLQGKLDDLLAEKKWQMEEHGGDPTFSGTPGLDRAIGMLRKQIGNEGSIDANLLQTLGYAGLRGLIGGAVGGAFGQATGNDPTMSALLGAAGLMAGPHVLAGGVGLLQHLTEGFRKAGSEAGATSQEVRAKAEPIKAPEPPTPAPDLQPLQSGGGMKRKARAGEEGAISPEIQDALSRAGIGAVIGAASGALIDDPGSNTNMVAGLAVVGLAAAFGPSIIKAIGRNGAKAAVGTNLPPPKSAFSNGWDAASVISRANLNVRNATSTSPASLADRAVERLDSWFSMSKNDALKRYIGKARGVAEEHLHKVDESFRKMKVYDVDDATRKATNEFLDGKIDEPTYRSTIGTGNTDLATYADFAVTARQSIDGLIEVAQRGVGSNSRAQMMKSSMGQYMRQSYKVFTDPKYRPSDQAVDALADKLVKTKAWGTLSDDQVRQALYQYVEDVKTQKEAYKPSASSRIDSTLFFQRNRALDAEWKNFLGEVTDPLERVNITLAKLSPLAQASDFMHQLAQGTMSEEGIPHIINSRADLAAEKAKALQALQSAPAQDRQAIQQRIDELDQYRYVAGGKRNGQFAGKYLHRTVADVMDEWEQGTKVDSGYQRAMMGLNSFMKANVTYRNPLSIVKQVVSSPMFMLIARANPKYLPDAYAAMKQGSSHPMMQELVQNGIANVDAVSRDVYRELDGHMTGLQPSSPSAATAWIGNIDRAIGNRFKKADMKMADMFRMPDNMVRISTYLSAKERIARQTGLALDHPDVIARATDFTNRYTMNYEHLTNVAKWGRQQPFINMFLSYTSEMGRILKNVAQDVAVGDRHGGPGSRMNAVMSLGALSVLPGVLQQIAEGNLSERDQKDWAQTKALMPSYQKDRYLFPTGRDPKTGSFNYVDFTSWIPSDQFNQMLRGAIDGRPSDALANNPILGLQNSPVLNIAASNIAGQNIHTGVEFSSVSDRIANTVQELGGPLTPGTGSVWRNLSQAFSPNSEGTLGLTDKQGRTLTPSDVAPWLVGLRSASVNPNTQKAKALSEFKQETANVMYHYNTVAKSNAPQDVKDRAADQARESVRQLKMSLALKLGIEPPAPEVAQ